MQETWVQAPGREDPLERGNGSPLLVSCAGKSHGQWSLIGYSPWGWDWT